MNAPPLYVFGLTGGIGTGKSTVARQMRALGVPVLDADLAAREVTAPGSAGLAAIVDAFGPTALDATGALDRAAMRARIVADPGARAQLEAITHPRIADALQREMAALAAAGAHLAGVEAALMVETGSWRRYASLVVVTCSPETQLARVMARDRCSREAAAAIVAAQLPLADKVALAHHVIVNDGALADLEAPVADVVTALRRAARGD